MGLTSKGPYNQILKKKQQHDYLINSFSYIDWNMFFIYW